MQKLLLVALATSTIAFSSAAQTGRIAHFSHGGSSATPSTEIAAKDNFGYPVSFVLQEVRRISDSTAVRRGYWHNMDERPKIDTIQFLTHDRRAVPENYGWFLPSCGPIQSLEVLRKNYPEAVFIGFDNAKSPVRINKKAKPAPTKPAGQILTFPKRPFQYSYWRGLAGAVALGAVGWLLGKKRAA